MKFESDAFLSYAHLDDKPLIDGKEGWVTRLHQKLERLVEQGLGKETHIWRDPKLKGNDLFSDTLMDRLRRVGAFVSIVTPRYMTSEWTQKELHEFIRVADAQGGVRFHNKSRVFKVQKSPVDLVEQGPELQRLLGYDFYKLEPHSDRVRPLDYLMGTDEEKREYWLKLGDLAQDICALLKAIGQSETPGRVTAPAASVFLADTTLDMKEKRDAIKRDLRQQGYAVLPDSALGTVGSELREAMKRDLANCIMSIHPIGSTYSMVPEGESLSMIELQNELAIERSATGGFSRLLWVPAGTEITDARQRQVVEQLQNDPRMADGADLLQSTFDDLCTVYRDVLERARTPAPEPPPVAASSQVRRLLLIYDQRDRDLIKPWGDYLFDQKLELLHPIFEGDEAEIREYYEETLRGCDGVLICYGSGNQLWFQRKLREVQKSPGLGRTKSPAVQAVCLLPPQSPEKADYRSHEMMVIPQFGGFAAEALLPFIAAVKAAQG